MEMVYGKHSVRARVPRAARGRQARDPRRQARVPQRRDQGGTARRRRARAGRVAGVSPPDRPHRRRQAPGRVRVHRPAGRCSASTTSTGCPTARLVIALDQISDPQNLGAVLRARGLLRRRRGAAAQEPLGRADAQGGADRGRRRRVRGRVQGHEPRAQPRHPARVRLLGVRARRARRAHAPRDRVRPPSRCSSSAPRARDCASGRGPNATRSCAFPGGARGSRA